MGCSTVLKLSDRTEEFVESKATVTILDPISKRNITAILKPGRCQALLRETDRAVSHLEMGYTPEQVIGMRPE